jgi:hypothetical protein
LNGDIGPEDLALDASNGNIYFSDASSKFYAKDCGTYGASLIDINDMVVMVVSSNTTPIQKPQRLAFPI